MKFGYAIRRAALLLMVVLGCAAAPAAAFDEQTWMKAMRAGTAYRDVGAFDRAEQAFAKALALEPTGTPAALNHWLLAEAITRQRRFEDAEPALKRAVAVIQKEQAGSAVLGEALEALTYVLGQGLTLPENAATLASQAREIRRQRNSPWVSDPRTLALKHTESGMTFPPRYALLERTHARRTRPDMPDVGVKYATMLDHGAITVTCIVYPSEGKSAIPLFEGARDLIAKRFKQAQRLSSGPATLITDGGDILALAARFARVDERSGKTVVEDLYLVERARHLIKTRITYLAEDASAAERQVSVLFRRLDWPDAD